MGHIRTPQAGSDLDDNNDLGQEDVRMKCRLCSGQLEPRITDLPFKIGDTSIVIVRAMPVLQCRQCGETELEDSAMRRSLHTRGGVAVAAGCPLRRN